MGTHHALEGPQGVAMKALMHAIRQTNQLLLLQVSYSGLQLKVTLGEGLVLNANTVFLVSFRAEWDGVAL